MPGQSDMDQLDKIWSICGSPNQQNWPDYDKLPGCEGQVIGSIRIQPHERRVKQVYESIGPETCDLLDKLLTLDPRTRITAARALDHDYFWSDPLPADPKTLPTYESSHEFDQRGRRHQQPQDVTQMPPNGNFPRPPGNIPPGVPPHAHQTRPPHHAKFQQHPNQPFSHQYPSQQNPYRNGPHNYNMSQAMPPQPNQLQPSMSMPNADSFNPAGIPRNGPPFVNRTQFAGPGPYGPPPNGLPQYNNQPPPFQQPHYQGRPPHHQQNRWQGGGGPGPGGGGGGGGGYQRGHHQPQQPHYRGDQRPSSSLPPRPEGLPVRPEDVVRDTRKPLLRGQRPPNTDYGGEGLKYD